MIEVRDPIVRYSKSKFSIEEYLTFEKSSPEKHEYYRGEIFAMSGAGARHNVIFSNLFTALGIRLKENLVNPTGATFEYT